MKISIFVLLLVLFSCGPQGSPGDSCSVSKTEGVSTISCPDGTKTKIIDGINGTDGSSSFISVTQASTSQCPQRGLVLNTQNGVTIDSNVVCDGQTGPQGQTGPSGVDVSSVSVVQFCPGQTIYPNSFPEFGICINSNIYAVYWDGTNSWLAEIIPGAYSSTSTSAPCSFNVAPACQISH